MFPDPISKKIQIRLPYNKMNLYLLGTVSCRIDTPLAPNIFGVTPIHYAAANGNLDTTKFLVGLKDTPNALDNHGNTPN